MISALIGTGAGAHLLGMLGRRVFKRYTDPKLREARQKKKYERARTQYQSFLGKQTGVDDESP